MLDVSIFKQPASSDAWVAYTHTHTQRQKDGLSAPGAVALEGYTEGLHLESLLL